MSGSEEKVLNTFMNCDFVLCIDYATQFSSVFKCAIVYAGVLINFMSKRFGEYDFGENASAKKLSDIFSIIRMVNFRTFEIVLYH